MLHCPYYPTLAPVDSKEKLCDRVNRGACAECKETNAGPVEISDIPIDEQGGSFVAAPQWENDKPQDKQKEKRQKTGGRPAKTKKHCASCGEYGFLEYSHTCTRCYKAKERHGKRINCRTTGCENMSTNGLCRSCYEGNKPVVNEKKCKTPGCDNPQKKGGVCQPCYNKAYNARRKEDWENKKKASKEITPIGQAKEASPAAEYYDSAQDFEEKTEKETKPKFMACVSCKHERRLNSKELCHDCWLVSFHPRKKAAIEYLEEIEMELVGEMQPLMAKLLAVRLAMKTSIDFNCDLTDQELNDWFEGAAMPGEVWDGDEEP